MGNYTDPVLYIKLTAILLAIMTTLIVLFKGKVQDSKYKKYVFLLFVFPTLISTLYIAGYTINKNIQSETGGPIHWHADYEVWACGERFDLVNPTGLKNKIGTPLFHEHDDDRIHVEGTVMAVADVSVGKFFETIGGKLQNGVLEYPVEGKGYVKYESGVTECDGQVGELKVYVNGINIDNYYEYIYYPHPSMPPGDCVIVEFGNNLPDMTDKVCIFWESAGWDYNNFKQLRKTKTNEPVWKDTNWEYIDGKGMIYKGGMEK